MWQASFWYITFSWVNQISKTWITAVRSIFFTRSWSVSPVTYKTINCLPFILSLQIVYFAFYLSSLTFGRCTLHHLTHCRGVKQMCIPKHWWLKPNREHSNSPCQQRHSHWRDIGGEGLTALPKSPFTTTSGPMEGSSSPQQSLPSSKPKYLVFPWDKDCLCAHIQGLLFIKGRNLLCSLDVTIFHGKSYFQSVQVAFSQQHCPY